MRFNAYDDAKSLVSLASAIILSSNQESWQRVWDSENDFKDLPYLLSIVEINGLSLRSLIHAQLFTSYRSTDPWQDTAPSVYDLASTPETP